MQKKVTGSYQTSTNNSCDDVGDEYFLTSDHLVRQRKFTLPQFPKTRTDCNCENEARLLRENLSLGNGPVKVQTNHSILIQHQQILEQIGGSGPAKKTR